jgi:hypothetical protein
MVDFLFDISAGTTHSPCNTIKDLTETLLPCTKNLWAAQTESEWQREYTSQLSFQRRDNHPHPTFGDLLRHGGDAGHMEGSLNRWLAQLDDLGTLVVAAANLSEGY